MGVPPQVCRPNTKLTMNNLITRTLAGAVYVALVVCSIYAGFDIFSLVLMVFGLLAIHEYMRMLTPDTGTQISRASTTVSYLAVVCAVAAAPMTFLMASYDVAGYFFIMLPVLLLLTRIVLGLYDPAPDALRRTIYGAFGIVYVGLPLVCAEAVRVQLAPAGTLFASSLSPASVTLMMFVMIWLNDTGAYCVGSLCGRHKLLPRISPAKTWEGFAGGMVFCVAAGIVFAVMTGRPVVAWAVIGLLSGMLATWGDLFESLIKRTAGVKDSGNVIPGHGGMLDRIDSLLFVAPAFAMMYIFL